MGLKQYKPTTPGQRFKNIDDFQDITKKKPEKSLLRPLKKRGGRDSRGRISVRHRGGGQKRHYRLIDFKRDKHDLPAKVLAIEYDPNRSARIALLQYTDGVKRYIIAPLGLKVNDQVNASDNAEVNPGNVLPLRNIPMGTMIHNLELQVNKGGQLIRSAGAAAQILAKEGKYAQVKMPSGEVRLIHLDCHATIGQVGNVEHENIICGKAGRKRWLGIRPTVRGVAMNPVDHPLGGGEGKSSGGRPGVSPWGQPAYGFRTRRNKRTANFIVKRRPKKKKKT